MTEAEALELADVTDWWIASWAGPCPMRTLREALGDAVARARNARVTLFRPGGFGKPAIWLAADDVERLHALLTAPKSGVDAAAAE
jgi:hypothetical protein